MTQYSVYMQIYLAHVKLDVFGCVQDVHRAMTTPGSALLCGGLNIRLVTLCILG